MAAPYLEELQKIVDRLRPGQPGGVQCKHFFSGAAAYIDDRIFMSLSPVGLALKLPESDLALLFDQGAKPLRYFPKSPVKKGYAVLSSQFLDDDKILSDWISRSIDFVQK